MTATEKRLTREVRALRGLVVELAEALYTHTRTDIAPDAALPKMRSLVRRLRKSGAPR